ncbi:hypothetical protein SEA_CULVER_56 [Gordonia phage Culver]|nr:hypothetical protein SEA_CULVER_56 [Gordonia phage Culver]
MATITGSFSGSRPKWVYAYVNDFSPGGNPLAAATRAKVAADGSWKVDLPGGAYVIGWSIGHSESRTSVLLPADGTYTLNQVSIVAPVGGPGGAAIQLTDHGDGTVTLSF